MRDAAAASDAAELASLRAEVQRLRRENADLRISPTSLAAEVADGDKLVRVGTARYRFARWSSYGAFLGTQADFCNEFTHSWKIPFTAAVPVAEADLQRGLVYLVATREGCHERHYERFGQPPVFYLPGKCDCLKPTLTADDFRSGAVAVLKRVE